MTEIKMRKLFGTLALAAALAASFGIPALAESGGGGRDKDFLIRWNLFEGSNSKNDPASPVVLSMTQKVPTLPQLRDAAKEPVKDLASIQNELASIYQLESVKPLISNKWAWGRKNEKALNALLLQNAILPIAFTMQKQPGNMVNVRVQVAQPADVNRSLPDLVDMEFLAKYDESVVLGFKLLDRSYFLAFEVLKEDAPESEPGLGSLMEEISFLPPSRPIVQTLPTYSPACKAAGIGGTVILRVDADTTGSVTRSEILKGVHPDLDRAAREAVLGWKYEPVLKDGKPVPVSFSLSLSFNPDRPSALDQRPENVAAPARTAEKPRLAEAPDPKLAGILGKAAEYCEKLKHAGLNFVCRERVQEWTLTGKRAYLGEPSGTRINLLYDYQLVNTKEVITERRTLLEENGVKTEVKDAPLKTKRFYSVKGIYGPVGFLSREWNGQYDYKLLREDKIEGRKAYVIEARPKTRIEGKPNFGNIWVDQTDFSVLRIDIEQESLPGFEMVLEQARKDNFKPAFTISHIYGVEKNGLRFPSQTVFVEVYKKIFRDTYNTDTNRVTMSNVTILYTDYQFFTVNVDVVYKAPLAPSES